MFNLFSGKNIHLMHTYIYLNGVKLILYLFSWKKFGKFASALKHEKLLTILILTKYNLLRWYIFLHIYMCIVYYSTVRYRTFKNMFYITIFVFFTDVHSWIVMLTTIGTSRYVYVILHKIKKSFKKYTLVPTDSVKYLINVIRHRYCRGIYVMFLVLHYILNVCHWYRIILLDFPFNFRLFFFLQAFYSFWM